MSKSNQKGRKGRLQDFVTHYLWNEELAKESMAQQFYRLTTKQRERLIGADEELNSIVVSQLYSCFEYQRALRLALTIADNSELPSDDQQLIKHTFKLAGTSYRALKRHGSRTGISNSERTRRTLEFYSPYLFEGFFTHLSGKGKPPGRSKLEYLARQIMKEDGLSRSEIDGLTQYIVRKFLNERKTAIRPGSGLLRSLQKNAGR
jgi:hypothetical protein